MIFNVQKLVVTWRKKCDRLMFTALGFLEYFNLQDLAYIVTSFTAFGADGDAAECL